MSLAAAVLALSMLVSAGAGAATSPRVTAVLTGHSQPRLRLRIIRNGTTVYDQPVRSRACGGYCVRAPVPPAKHSVFVGDLQGGGEPDVVVGLFTGGAHCCFVDQVFTYDAARSTYVTTEHDFLDAGARIQRLNGQLVFRSADARVAENSFTDYAASGSPLQIWRFSGRRFVDVTRQYPTLIHADAANWWSAFNHNISNGVGLIAPWAADEYLLGNAAPANSTLDRLAREHKLHSALGLPHNSETAFVAELKKLLSRLGYAR